MTHMTSKAVLGAAILGTALAFGNGAQAAEELKIATFMGPPHHLNSKVFPKWIEAVKEATNGEIAPKLYAGGQLGKGPVQQYKRVVDNVSEIAFGIQGYTSTLFPRTMIVTQPGIGQTAEDYTKAAWKVYDQYLAEEYSKVKVLGIWANTPPVLIMRKKKVTSIADVKGLKIRALDATNIPQVNAWGASGIHIPISGVYDALDKGVIDGVYVAVNAVYNPWRFGEVAEHVIDGMNSPTALFWYAMNKKVWDGLPASAKAGIDKVSGREFSIETAVSWAQPDFATIEKLKAGDPKTSYSTLSKEAAAEFNAATARSVEEALAAAEAKGIPARAIYKAAASPSS